MRSRLIGRGAAAAPIIVGLAVACEMYHDSENRSLIETQTQTPENRVKKGSRATAGSSMHRSGPAGPANRVSQRSEDVNDTNFK